MNLLEGGKGEGRVGRGRGGEREGGGRGVEGIYLNNNLT